MLKFYRYEEMFNNFNNDYKFPGISYQESVNITRKIPNIFLNVEGKEANANNCMSS